MSDESDFWREESQPLVVDERLEMRAYALVGRAPQVLPWAHAQIDATPSRIRVIVPGLFGVDIIVHRTRLTRIARHRDVRNVGFRLEHDEPEVPAFVLIGSPDREALEAALIQLGYEIDGSW